MRTGFIQPTQRRRWLSATAGRPKVHRERDDESRATTDEVVRGTGERVEGTKDETIRKQYEADEARTTT